MAETPPGLANLKLWMTLNDNAATSVVINEVGDNGVFWSEEAEGNTTVPHVASGNPPYLNGAFSFLSENPDYIVVPDSAQISITGDISFSFHFYKNADANKNIAVPGDTNGHRSWYLTVPDGQRIALAITPDIEGGWQANREYCMTDAAAYSDATWVHCVITYDADGDGGNGFMRCYIDSVEVAFQANKTDTLPSSINDSDEPLTIGQWLSTYFDGKLDNFMIFDKVLTQDNANWLAVHENPFMSRPLVGGPLAGNSLVGKGLAR